jgi:hypothetical protein
LVGAGTPAKLTGALNVQSKIMHSIKLNLLFILQ